MNRSLKIKVVKETKTRVSIFMVGLNRKMTVSQEEFAERVESGLYTVVSKPKVEEEETAEE